MSRDRKPGKDRDSAGVTGEDRGERGEEEAGPSEVEPAPEADAEAEPQAKGEEETEAMAEATAEPSRRGLRRSRPISVIPEISDLERTKEKRRRFFTRPLSGDSGVQSASGLRRRWRWFRPSSRVETPPPSDLTDTEARAEAARSAAAELRSRLRDGPKAKQRARSKARDSAVPPPVPRTGLPGPERPPAPTSLPAPAAPASGAPPGLDAAAAREADAPRGDAAAGSPAGAAPQGGRADSQPGRRSDSQPGRRADSQPGGHADSQPGTRAPSQPGTRAPSQPGTRAPSQPGTRAPSRPGIRAPSRPGIRAPSQPGIRAASPGARTIFQPEADSLTGSVAVSGSISGRSTSSREADAADARSGHKRPSSAADSARSAESGEHADASRPSGTRRRAERVVVDAASAVAADRAGAGARQEGAARERAGGLRLWRRPLTELTRPLAWQRHDLLVVVVAVALFAGGVVGQHRLAAPSLSPFDQLGLHIGSPSGWLPARRVGRPAAGLVARAEKRGDREPEAAAPEREAEQAAPAGLPYHIQIQSSLDPVARLEIRIAPRPTTGNLRSALVLERVSRHGEALWAAESADRTIGGRDWVRTAFRYAYKGSKTDAPRIATAIEYATINGRLLYTVTFHGASGGDARRLEALLIPTLAVDANHPAAVGAR
jgi:hypothetical protein